MWVWALAFIAVLLVIGWVIDRRAKRRRVGRLVDPMDRIASAERIDPGTASRATWISGGDSGGGYGGVP